MNPFKKNNTEHEWQLVATTYAPPIKNIQPNVTDTHLLEKALFGVTTLIWECKITGEVRTEEVIGSTGNQLEEILDKAEQYGMQTISHNGNKFAIALVPQDDVNIPLR